jgi:hypothetical protein
VFATLTFRLGTDVSVAAVSSTLHANVGPGYDISLTFDDGTPVAALPAGTYRVVVIDQGQDHNFHLLGPGVDEFTSVESSAPASWTVTFRNNNTYFFLCDPHADSMAGRFEVGSTPKAAGRVVATVLAGIDRAGKLRLTLKGKPVKTLGPGSYKIVASDSSAKDGVVLRRIGRAGTLLTGSSFVGKHTLTTELTAGQWKLYSTRRGAAGALFFRVTSS